MDKAMQDVRLREARHIRALDLMDAALVEGGRWFLDMVLAYGQNDHSLTLHGSISLLDRRASKRATLVTTTVYCGMIYAMADFIPRLALTRPHPTFDGRCLCYPRRNILRNYLNWP